MITDETAISEATLEEDQNDIEEMCTYVMAVIDTVKSKFEPQPQPNGTSNDSVSSIGHITARLPKLELIKFNGDFMTWTTFINLYNTTIHMNSSLTNIIKFQYLLSVLSGEPLNLIRNLSLTEQNYLIAYQMLIDRYQNDRRLQLMHLDRIIDLPNISSNHVTDIRQFLNIYNENIQALCAIDCDIRTSNPLLSAILLRKMDVDLRKRLESFRNTSSTASHSLPTTQQIIDFLTQECNQHEDATCTLSSKLKDVQINNTRIKPYVHTGTSSRKVAVTSMSQCATLATNHTQNTCAACDKTSHKTYLCPVFLSKTPQERFQIVKNRQHCISCLGMHDLKKCKSQSTCKQCHQRHNTLLHFNTDKPESYTMQASTSNHNSSILKESVKSQNTDTAVTLSSQYRSNHEQNLMVLLGTILVNLRTSDGISHSFRALLDSGSMTTLITERAANILNARRHYSDIQISGINQSISRTKGQIFVTLETLTGQPIVHNHSMIILNKLTINLPRIPVSNDVVQQVQHYNLADPTFHIPSQVDVILGASLFPHILSGRQISLGDNMPCIIESPFGHIVMGTTPCTPSDITSTTPHTTTLNLCLHSISNEDIHNSIQRFWIQEEVPNCSVQSQEDTACEQIFIETHSRDKDGRYTVRLPFKTSSQSLGSSLNAAENRLFAMERKFATNEQFSTLYHEFMEEYSNLGHMTKCDITVTDEAHYFLPHHGVFKEASTTTKLRTVFDASCKTSSGFSLNDMLLTGKKLQTDITDVLMQFRRHSVVFCCDIRQMYRQINIHPDDRNFQLILWRSTPNDPIDVYQLNTVTYGMNSSPYLAIRTLQQLAIDEGHNFPEAAHALINHTYVDDIITGADTLESAMELQTQIIALLKKGCFELRKWVSNSPQLLHQVPESHVESPKFLPHSQDPQFTVLGLQWSPTTDTFSYNTHLPEVPKNPTKRIILSTIAKIYDPCGFLTPYIMLAKCLIQLIWTLGLHWDTPLPPEVNSQWTRLMEDTRWLSHISISRSINCDSSGNVQLHGFCDASESGYAAVIYLRCEQPNGETVINMILAKSRVAPLKRVTIPRLELCAAHLLSRLVKYCLKLFPNLFTMNNIYLWTDSTIVLTWICTPPYRLKTYVANRVSQIQEIISPETWHHITSEENPADCASRGLLLSHLVTHSMWWHGPSWLKLPSQNWPIKQFVPVTLDDSHEIKNNPLPVLIVDHQDEWPLLTKYSSWTQLQRVMVLILRFISKCRRQPTQQGSISVEELDKAKNKIFYIVQQSTLHAEYNMLTNNVCPSSLRQLTPFVDEDHLIRVGGRLNKSLLSYNEKHPILLPKRHHVVNILIDHHHIQNLHAGPQLVQSILTRHVWILNARNVIRLRIHKCIICFRLRPTNTIPLMADLPAVRTTPAKPFLSTGVDYCGPFTVKLMNLRFMKQIKVYLCIFICMVTKAIHIEVVTDLTTDAFIAALTRFTARRGICKDIYSDCGKNFVGADAQLRKIIKSTIHHNKAKNDIQNFSAKSSITFHFNPPAAPHHGGLWESAVKSAKHHLHRVMGTSTLTLPEFITLSTRIEAMLNSRPLTPLSNDPGDLSALTPGHFLTGDSLVSIPEQDLTLTATNRLKQWQTCQQHFQKIWKRWKIEYLHTLQQRVKWNKTTHNLNIGDLVLVKTITPPLCWPLGRIVELYPGSDKIVRVVKIQTQDGTYVRPVTKLFKLPLQNDVETLNS